CQKYSYPPYSF
nr:immunoglobulin light chain junction region [Macaca mulatta]